jgi:hypothetical protein
VEDLCSLDETPSAFKTGLVSRDVEKKRTELLQMKGCACFMITVHFQHSEVKRLIFGISGSREWLSFNG